MTAAMLRRAGGVTLCVYALQTLAASLVTWPLTSALFAAPAGTARLQPERGAALLLLEVAAQRGRSLAPWALGIVAAHALLAALIGLCWLHAMADTTTIGATCKHALRDYPAALALGGSMLVGSGAALGLGFLGLRAGLSALPASEDAERALRTIVACTAGGAVFWLATGYDLARAALVAGCARGTGPLHALRTAWNWMSWSALARHALLMLAAAALVLVAEALGRLELALRSPLVLLASQQALVFAGVCLRGAWLAWALQRCGARPPRSGSPAPHAT
jgi:hypothetical protein